MKKEVTIYDLASELNVAPSTVSRALKDHFSIGAITKKRVLQLAAEKGYGIRRNVATTLSTIGVIVSNINQPRIASMIKGIEKVADENGFSVIISQSQDKVKNEIARTKSLSIAGVAGLIVLPASETTNTDHFNQFKSRNIPVVFMDRKPDGFTSGCVIVDYFNAARQATLHLIDQGCRRIAFIGQTPGSKIYAEKLRGYLEALREYGISADESLILTKEILGSKEAAWCAMNLLDLSDPPDAIFCDNDDAGVGVIQYAKTRNLRVPHDLAVVGFNNDSFSLIIDPSLSTVAHPAVEMGEIATREVFNQYQSRVMDVRSVILKADLIVRQSSQRA